MGPWLAMSVFAAGTLIVARSWREISLRRRALIRLDVGAGETSDAPLDEPLPVVVRPFARRWWWQPWAGALVLGLALRWLAGWPPVFCGALAFVAGLLLQQADALRLAWLAERIENQLADAIDLMVSSLKAGAGLETAIGNAAGEAPRPLRGELDELLARIRLGEPPRGVLDRLARRVPLETFQLFALALAVNWEVGGSLTNTLATVGRTVRNRIEIARRIAALTSQARASIVAVLLTTYFIAALMWRNNPDRMDGFLNTSFGQGATAVAMVLQGVGIVWITYLSKPRF